MPPTYASVDDFEAYVPGWVTENSAELERLLEAAERDVDVILGPVGIYNEAAGLKYDPAELAAWEAAALSRAVCAQALHLFANPNAVTGERQAKRIKGPDFEQEFGDAGAGSGRYSPRLRTELAPITHLRGLGARARA
jgi:hypothetical protein